MGIRLVPIFGYPTMGAEVTSGDRESVDQLTPYERGSPESLQCDCYIMSR